MTNLLFLARMPAFGLEDTAKSAKCDQDFRLTYMPYLRHGHISYNAYAIYPRKTTKTVY